MLTRYLITLGATTTAGGKVSSGSAFMSIDEAAVALEGDTVWCPACKSEGVIVLDGPRLSSTVDEREEALDDDLCLCKCSPPPRLVASQSLECQEIDTDWHGDASEATARAAAQHNGAAGRAGAEDSVPLVLLDPDTQEPLRYRPYRLQRAGEPGGAAIEGTTTAMAQRGRSALRSAPRCSPGSRAGRMRQPEPANANTGPSMPMHRQYDPCAPDPYFARHKYLGIPIGRNIVPVKECKLHHYVGPAAQLARGVAVHILTPEHLWATFQAEAEQIVSVDGRLTGNDEERNRRINAAYARLWLADNRFQWAALTAFASKQVGCGLLHAGIGKSIERSCRSVRHLPKFGKDSRRSRPETSPRALNCLPSTNKRTSFKRLSTTTPPCSDCLR